MYRLLISSAIIFLIASCQKEGAGTLIDSAFPNKVGDQWFYELTEENDGSVKNIEVDIIGAEIVNGQTVTLWRYFSSKFFNGTYDYIDTNYVAAINDTIKIFQDSQLKDELMRYVFPLQSGEIIYAAPPCNDSTIILGKCTDTIKVNASEDVVVPAGGFSNSFKVSQYYYHIDFSYRDTLWFKEGTGVVKRHQMTQIAPLPGDGIWKLISYNVY